MSSRNAVWLNEILVGYLSSALALTIKLPNFPSTICMFLQHFYVVTDFPRNFIAFFAPPAHFCFVVWPHCATMMLERAIILLCVLSISELATLLLILLISSNNIAHFVPDAQQTSTVAFRQQNSDVLTTDPGDGSVRVLVGHEARQREPGSGADPHNGSYVRTPNWESIMSTITVSFPAVFVVRCAKINQDVSVAVNESTLRHWVKYGAKQDLNDGHSAIKRDQFGTEREWHLAVGNYAAKWKAQREAGIVPGSGGLELSADELKMVLAMRAEAAKKKTA